MAKASTADIKNSQANLNSASKSATPDANSISNMKVDGVSLDTFVKALDTTEAALIKVQTTIEKVQSIGLPGIKDILKKLWDFIKSKLLSLRQIAKKVLMLSSYNLPIPMTEERAHLCIYGKLYYRNGVLEDNDIKYPECVGKIGEEYKNKANGLWVKVQTPIDIKKHPLILKIKEWIRNLKDTIIQIGIKLGEVIVAIKNLIVAVIKAILALVACFATIIPGSGVPSALTAVGAVMAAVKALQAKFGEFLALIWPLLLLIFLLGKFLTMILKMITGILDMFNKLVDSMNSLLKMFDKLTKLYDKTSKKYDNMPTKLTLTASPNPVEKDQKTTIKAEISGPRSFDTEWQYEWTDSYGNFIENDPKNGDLDIGTRELTPYIIDSDGSSGHFSEYTCKVTDINAGTVTDAYGETHVGGSKTMIEKIKIYRK